MTLLEKFRMEHGSDTNDYDKNGYPMFCPYAYYPYNYAEAPSWCSTSILISSYENECKKCWDREIPEESQEYWDEEKKEIVTGPKILDSGARREFGTGAVRDIQEGKGRCDLLPLDVVASIIGDNPNKPDPVSLYISKFQVNGDIYHLYEALEFFTDRHFTGDTLSKSWYNMLLEVSIHFEEGAEKYGESNWKFGIPVRCYIDSAVRHYLKFLRGDKDEPHDRAFCWNIMCAIWTCKHKPELNDYAKKETPDI